MSNTALAQPAGRPSPSWPRPCRSRARPRRAGRPVGAGAPRDGAPRRPPKRKVDGDRAVQAVVLRAAGREARPRARRQGHQPASRSSTASPSSCPPSRRRCSRSERTSSGSRSTRRVHSTGLDASQLATSYPKTTRADKLWQRGITGRGVGVAVIDTGVAGDLPDFKGAAGARASSPTSSPPRAPPRRATASATARTSPASSPATRSTARRGDPLYGKYVGMAPEREPDRGQGRRRGRQLDRARRHQRHRVRRRPQGRVQHPRAQPLAEHATRRSPTRPTRSTRPSSTPGRRASSSSPPPATAAPPPTPSSTPRPTTRS